MKLKLFVSVLGMLLSATFAEGLTPRQATAQFFDNNSSHFSPWSNSCSDHDNGDHESHEDNSSPTAAD